jgi:hypothetical protein
VTDVSSFKRVAGQKKENSVRWQVVVPVALMQLFGGIS